MRALLPLVLVACTVSTTDNFQNPPPPPPATCAADGTVTGCTAGSAGYTCTSDCPDDGDTNLVCSVGRPAPGGTSFCCLPYGQYFSDCTTSTTVSGCAEPGFGFSCSGAVRPDDADSRLACGVGAVAGFYCCVSGVSASCTGDPHLVCPGASAGFVCAGDASPGQGDAPVACLAVGSGENGATLLCCIPFLQSPSTCEENEHAGCSPNMFGFTCAGLHRPEDSNAHLACSASPAASGSFCCAVP